MKNQEISQKICPQCGAILASKETTCAKCSKQNSSSNFGNRIWLAFGLFFMILSVGILAGTFWYVENRRLNKIATPTSFTPLTNATDPTLASLDLNKLTTSELLSLVPVKVLTRYRTSTGENLPEQTSIINQDGDQYLVLLGLERINDEDKQFLASVFKLEGGALSDISREALPVETDKLIKVTANFINKGPDFDIKMPVQTELFENCEGNECEQVYAIQEVAWCGTDYQMGVKNWSNDPYTILYIFAQALDKRSLPVRDRSFVATTLDPLISQGFDRGANGKWQVKNLTTDNLFQLKTLNKVSYSLSNGTESIIVNIEKQENGIWQATSLEDSDAPSNTDLTPNDQ